MVEVVDGLRTPTDPGPSRESRIHFDVEGILTNVLVESVEEDAIVPGVRSDVSTDTTDIAGEGSDEEDGAVLEIAVEELVRPHAHHEERCFHVVGDLPREGADGGRGRPGDLLDLLWRVDRIEVPSRQREHRRTLDAAPVDEGDGPLALESGFDPRLGEGTVHLVPIHHRRTVLRSIPDDEVPPLPPFGIGQHRSGLGVDGWCGLSRLGDLNVIRECRRLVVRHDVCSAEEFPRIESHQMGEVRVASHVVRIVEALGDEHLGQPQGKRRGRSRTHDDDLVRLAGGRAVLGRDHHDPSALHPRLGQPVGVRHLRGDPVHPPDDGKTGVFDVAEVEVDGLLPGDHGVAGGKVRVP